MYKWILPVLIILVAFFAGINTALGMEKTVIRPSAFSGNWYPADPGELRRSIREYLSKAKKEAITGELIALIVPHAGHKYSGPVAAYAYNLLN